MNDPLANPFRKREGEDKAQAPRPVRPADGTPREMIKLYVMALVFFMAVGTMIYMWKTVTAPKPKPDVQGVRVRSDGSREGTPEPPPLPPVKKEVPLQDLPKDGVVDFRKLAEPFVDSLEAPVKETPEFVAMLRVMLNSIKAEELAKRANPALTADLAYHNISTARGDVVRSYGRLVKIYTEPLDTTIPERVEHVYLGIMMEYPTNRTVWFYMPSKPVDAAGEPIKFNKYAKRGEEFYEDWVEVEGVVLRRYDYPSQHETDKGDTAWARALVTFAKTPRLAAKPQIKGGKAFFTGVVVTVAVILVSVVLVAGVMSRKYGGGDRSLRMAVAAMKRAKAKESSAVGAPKDDVPPPAPPPTTS